MSSINAQSTQPSVSSPAVPTVPATAVSSTDISSLVDQLQALGFTKRGMNIAMLYANGMDVTRAAEALRARREKRDKKKCESATKDDEVKYANQLTELNKQGYIRVRRNIRLLKTHEGNIDNVIKSLRDVNDRRAALREPKAEWEAALVSLESKGFTNTKCNIRLLHRFEGNVDAVESRLRDLKQRREQRGHHGHAHRHGRHKHGDGEGKRSASDDGKDGDAPKDKEARRALREANRARRETERAARHAERDARRAQRHAHKGEHGHRGGRRHSHHHQETNDAAPVSASVVVPVVTATPVPVVSVDGTPVATPVVPSTAVTDNDKKCRHKRERKARSGKGSSSESSGSSSVTSSTDATSTDDEHAKDKKKKRSHKGKRGDKRKCSNKSSLKSSSDNVNDDSSMNTSGDGEKKGRGRRHGEAKDDMKKGAFDGMEFAGYQRASWPAAITNLYLDGNNMLYVTNAIRKLALKRSNVHEAENALAHIANSFTMVMGSQLKSSLLMFDNPNGRRATKASNGSDYVIRMVNARPAYRTSDDYLVSIATENKAQASSSLYVTSDRELAHRLLATGTNVCKPKEWFHFAAAIIAAANQPSSSSSSAPVVAPVAVVSSPAVAAPVSSPAVAPAAESAVASSSSTDGDRKRHRHSKVKSEERAAKPGMVDIDDFTDRFLGLSLSASSSSSSAASSSPAR